MPTKSGYSCNKCIMTSTQLKSTQEHNRVVTVIRTYFINRFYSCVYLQDEKAIKKIPFRNVIAIIKT